MYIVAKGQCQVNIRGKDGIVIKGHKELGTSEYFGEIALLYGCRRTATIVSSKYSTLAKLSLHKFKGIATEFPDLVDVLKKGIYQYNDPMKRFMKQSLVLVDYFQSMSP